MARHSGRDTNLTDTLFRLHSLLGDALDEAAHEREPELDAIVAARQRGAWWRFDRVFNTAYEVDTTHAWLHPTVRRWYALWKYPEPMRHELELRSLGPLPRHARRRHTSAGQSIAFAGAVAGTAGFCPDRGDVRSDDGRVAAVP